MSALAYLRNPAQHAKSVFKFVHDRTPVNNDDCCGGVVNPYCQYRISIASWSGKNIRYIVFKDPKTGTNKRIDLGSNITDETELLDAVITAATNPDNTNDPTEGYPIAEFIVVDTVPNHKPVEAEVSGGALILDIYANVEIVEVLNGAEASQGTATKNCSTVGQFTYTLTVGTVAQNSVLSVGGTTATIATSAALVAGVDAVGDVETAIATHSLIEADDVDVVLNADSDAYIITLTLKDYDYIKLNSTYFQKESQGVVEYAA